jgi:hypothetical protein
MKDNTRRKFLKKVAYTAPAVVALGALTNATKAEAGPFGGGHGDKVSRIRTKVKDVTEDYR